MRKLLLIAVVLTVAAVSQADLLVAYDFNGYAGTEVQGTSTTVNADMVDPAYIERGDGVGISANGNRFNGNNWDEAAQAASVTDNDYFSWTIASDPGSQFNVTNMIFNFQRSGTGGTEWFLRSSADGFTANLDTWTGLSNGTETSDLSSAGLTNLTSVEMRLYGWGASSSAGTAGFEGTGDDLIINGTIGAIPEPATMAMMGAGLVALLYYRRRRS